MTKKTEAKEKRELAVKILEHAKKNLPDMMSPAVLKTYGIQAPENAEDHIKKFNDEMVDFYVKNYSLDQLRNRIKVLGEAKGK